jgi:hypothetical protein
MVTSMGNMFKSASAFNQNLCQWRFAFPYSNALNIFASSGCTNTDTPVLTTRQNWCAVTTC